MAGEKNSKYKSEYNDLAYNYALLGVTDKQLAEFFDVCEATLNNWKNDHPSFLESLKKGKSQADAMVAKSLFQRALGYSHPETKIVTHNGAITDSQDVVKHYAPDTAAGIFWLKNRQPDIWRDKKEVSLDNGDVTPWDEIGENDDESDA